MDHRAITQSDRINAMGHPVLECVGGRISPEMETPKLLWLRENRPQVHHATTDFLDLADHDFARIGRCVVAPGTPPGAGQTIGAADDLGWLPGTAVAAGMIDAHAGGIGGVGCDGSPQTTMAYVVGPSSCTMATTGAPEFVPGVWRPNPSAMVPGMWLNAGGNPPPVPQAINL